MWGDECPTAPLVGGRGHSSTHTHKKHKEREAGQQDILCVSTSVCACGRKRGRFEF